MVPKTLIDRLLSHDIHMIGLGDPFQLPPVNKNEDNHLLDDPHIFLDEIMRQAAESEIIQLTMKIRSGEKIENFKGKEVQVINKSELTTGMLFWANQVLVATNATRKSINNQMRELLGHGDLPETGDKIICCRNYWNCIADDGSALVNGTIGTLDYTYPSFLNMPKFINPKIVDTINGVFIGECGEDYGEQIIDKKMLMEGEKSLDWANEYKLLTNKKYTDLIPAEFAYGYAITTHRAQGSEWDKVLVIEEDFPFDKEEHARWLYTALTRGSKKVVLVKND